ncbi:MAG: molybdenum cofactor guanylyltransferase [Phycisphaerae bacterium]
MIREANSIRAAILLAMTLVVGILVGGESRRMGFEKALIPVSGVTLIEQTAALAATVSDRVVLLGQVGFELPRLVAALRVIEDIHRGIGPMGGLESLMLARPDDAWLLLACDMPYLTGEALQRLCTADDSGEAVAFRTGGAGGQWHPCCALYRAEARPAVEAAIAARRHSLVALLSNLRTTVVDLAGAEARWVENWNSPEDLLRGTGLDDGETGKRQNVKKSKP